MKTLWGFFVFLKYKVSYWNSDCVILKHSYNGLDIVVYSPSFNKNDEERLFYKYLQDLDILTMAVL